MNNPESGEFSMNEREVNYLPKSDGLIKPESVSFDKVLEKKPLSDKDKLDNGDIDYKVVSKEKPDWYVDLSGCKLSDNEDTQNKVAEYLKQMNSEKSHAEALNISDPDSDEKRKSGERFIKTVTRFSPVLGLMTLLAGCGVDQGMDVTYVSPTETIAVEATDSASQTAIPTTNPDILETQTPDVTDSPTQTESPTEAPTLSPTESPNPTQTESPTTAPTQTEAPIPTETVDKEAELKAEINKNIKDFLNHEGEFTDEKIQEMIMWSSNYYHKKGNVELGLMSECNSKVANLQGVLLGYFERNGDIITVMGFDGKDGSRFATFGKIETSAYDKMKFGFGIRGLNGSFDDNFEIVEEFRTNDMDVILGYLEPLKRKTATFGFITANLSKEDLNYIAEDTPERQSIQDAFIGEAENKIKLHKKLAGEVVSNDLELQFKISKDVKIVKTIEIENIGDGFEIDDSQIFLITALAFKE